MRILIFIALLVGLVLLIHRLTRTMQTQTPPRQKDTGGMAVTQARALLGLENEPIDADKVIAAHRRLMQKVHPDKGGSALLAQQLNEAKRVLLADLMQ